MPVYISYMILLHQSQLFIYFKVIDVIVCFVLVAIGLTAPKQMTDSKRVDFTASRT